MYSGQHADARKPSIGRKLASLLGMVVLIVALSWGLRTFVFQAYEIPSGSMEETIMTGDMVFSEKVSYYLGEPERGDIVTFADPEIPSRILIKRVIATEGETVELIDGRVVIDGVALVEPYTRNLPSYPLTPAYGEDISYPYTVGEGELWVMGDNRTNSQDSRYFGAIDASTVTGKAVLTYWPLDRFGLLSSEG
ncbi:MULTISPECIES: signal peptidase I [unclassified Adlercreutzia]|uniref:signal peptidase I n=1 Tax=unclassified Adlercreutzia TaxID=2636013 RepID=UPI0013EB476E|nr:MULTISPECIES: signal peptidase I [unclassified Adlercreutzia]